MAQCNFSRIRISPQRPRVLHHEIRGVPAAVPTKLAWVPSREVECHFLLLGGVVLLFDVPVSLFWCSVFGFRISPSRFPGLGPTQGSWPVRVSCVEAFTQFAFHRPCTPRHARVRAHGSVFEPAVNMRNTRAPGLLNSRSAAPRSRWLVLLSYFFFALRRKQKKRKASQEKENTPDSGLAAPPFKILPRRIAIHVAISCYTARRL